MCNVEYLIHFKNRQTPVLSENSCFSNQAGRSFRKAKSPERKKEGGFVWKCKKKKPKCFSGILHFSQRYRSNCRKMPNIWFLRMNISWGPNQKKSMFWSSKRTRVGWSERISGGFSDNIISWNIKVPWIIWVLTIFIRCMGIPVFTNPIPVRWTAFR